MTQSRSGVGYDDPPLYTVCERLTEVILYAMVVFGPWAFGTTQPWAIQVMNTAGFALGGLLGLKWIVRRATSHQPPRWDDGPRQLHRWMGRGLALMTVLVCGYCALSAWNARCAYWHEEMRMEYRECIEWLPHSYDANRSWHHFWMYLALACSFWALRDWLLHKEAKDETDTEIETDEAPREWHRLPARRLRRLLWVLSINGVLLAAEATFQRVSGETKLLWLIEPAFNKTAEGQFGPYAYRSNAAQYFNLVWPGTLALWWAYQLMARHRNDAHQRRMSGNHHILLGCAGLMIMSPLISTSRAGAVIGGALVVGVGLVLLAGNRQVKLRVKSGVIGLVLLFVAGAFEMDFNNLWARMQDLDQGFAERNRIYELSRQMVTDSPLFGTGPGTYKTLYQFYRSSITDTWYAQAHNDWLETRITFGWLGSLLIAGAFILAAARWLARGGIVVDRRFVGMLWLALAGCLVHARFDFPFQIHSVLFVFLVYCAALSCVTRRA